MKLRQKIRTKLSQNRFTRWVLNYDARTVIFTVGSLVITASYGAFYAMLCIALRSVWYGMLAWYYLMIVVMRATVVFYHKGKRKRGARSTEYAEQISRAKIYGRCGIIISLLTLPLSLAIMMMIAEKASFSHAGLMIYVSATYTTYKVVMTVRHLIKARKSTDMTIRSVRCINLADTLVSLLALQTAMFHSFSPEGDWSIMNGVTGAVVCLSTVLIGAYMIYNGRRAIKTVNYEVNLNKEKSL